MFLTPNEIITPFVTGFVGYFTNFLAIKMLFRPHKRKIYSFGWQGVIPKNRAKLAKEVGELVGNNLLTEKDIVTSLREENFQLYLQNSVRKELRDFLSRDFGKLEDILDKFGTDSKVIITYLYDKLLLNEDLVTTFLKESIDALQEIKLSDFVDIEESLKNASEKLLKEGKWQEKIVKEVSAYLNNLILSGISLKQVLPDNIYQSIIQNSENVTLKVLDYIKNLSEDDDVKEKIVQKLIEIKNNSFNSGVFDQLKLGMLNIFLNEDVIRDLVKSKFPEIIQNISNSEEIKDKITLAIQDKIKVFLEKPIYKLIERFRVEDFYSLKISFESKLLLFLKSDFLVNRVKYIITSNSENLKNLKIKDVFDILDIDLTQTFEGRLIVRRFKDDDTKNQIVLKLAEAFKNIKIANIYDKLSQKSFRKAVEFLSEEINELIIRNVNPILKTLDIKYIVENKINSLNLYEVENMLFSFMKQQFKWINILGFVLGFIFGCIQILFFKLT